MLQAGVRALLGLGEQHHPHHAAGGAAHHQQPHQQPNLASRAARALGLSPMQARTLIAAQMAVPQLQQKGTPFLRSASDIIDFVSKYNPRSSHRQTQLAAQGPTQAALRR